MVPAMEVYGKSRHNRLVPKDRRAASRRLTRADPQDERHSYEKCQYDEFKKRVAKMDELRASKEGARSN